MPRNRSGRITRGLIRKDVIETLRAASFAESNTTIGNIIMSSLNGKDLKTISDGKLLEGLKGFIEQCLEREEVKVSE